MHLYQQKIGIISMEQISNKYEYSLLILLKSFRNFMSRCQEFFSVNIKNCQSLVILGGQIYFDFLLKNLKNNSKIMYELKSYIEKSSN